MLILGVDPGISGAIAAVSPNGALQWVLDMPIRDAGRKTKSANEIDGVALGRLLRMHLPDIAHIAIEEVSANGLNGSIANFGLGDSRGCIRGVIECLGISVERVSPQRWKAHYGLKFSKETTDTAKKEASRACAVRIYPGATCLARKKDHGRAEACLIARYSALQSRLADSFLGERRPALELVA